MGQLNLGNGANFVGGSSGFLTDAPKGFTLQKVILQSDTKATPNVTSFTEPSSDYRVSITPKNSTSRIYLTYFMNTNTAMASNTLFMIKAQKFTSGSAANITSTPSTSGMGSRYPVDFAARPSNGQDANDQTPILFLAYDDPGSISTQTYGFTYRREAGGSGVIYFGRSNNDNAVYGMHHPVTIIAEEVAQ